MKKLKVTICSLLVLCSCFVFAACGEKEEDYQPKTILVNATTTFEQAVEQANAGDTVKLEQDIIISAQVVVNKAITIDLGGYKISNTTDIWNNAEGVKTWSLISVQQGGNLTIKNGTLHAKENDCYPLDVREGATLTVESGTYIGNCASIYNHKGTVYVKGGTFDMQQLDPSTKDKRFMLNCYDANYANGSAKIYVSGGTFADFNPAGSIGEIPTANYVVSGYKSVSVETDGVTYYTVVAE